MENELTQKQINHSKLTIEQKCDKFYESKGGATEKQKMLWKHFLENQLAFPHVSREEYWLEAQKVSGSEYNIGKKNGGRKGAKKAKPSASEEEIPDFQPEWMKDLSSTP